MLTARNRQVRSQAFHVLQFPVTGKSVHAWKRLSIATHVSCMTFKLCVGATVERVAPYFSANAALNTRPLCPPNALACEPRKSSV